MAYGRRRAPARRRSTARRSTTYSRRRTYSRAAPSRRRTLVSSRRRAAPRAQTLRIVLQQDTAPQLAMLGATGETVSSVRETAPRKRAQF